MGLRLKNHVTYYPKKTAYDITMATATLLLLACSLLSSGLASAYYIGVGRYDITGPAAEVEMVIWLIFNSLKLFFNSY